MAAVPNLRPHLLPFLCFSLLFFPSSSAALPEESDALLTLKKSFTNATRLDSWAPGSPPPCTDKGSWVGVVCFHGSITGLHLSRMGLSGKIDIDALTSFPTLRTISFIGNDFEGPIPDFNRLGALKALYLTGNHFSGIIPSDFFSKMASLKKVWLARNEFTGPIPTSLSKLPHLMELHLEKNHFTGSIPSFEQAMLKSFDVSNNELEGSIPESLSKFNSSSFDGNAAICGEQVGKACTDTIAASTVAVSGTDGGKSSTITLVITMLILLACLVGLAVVFAVRKRDNEFDMLGRDIGDHVVSVHVGDSNRKESVRRESVRRESHHGKKGAGPPVPDLVMVNEEKGTFGLPDLMKAAAEVLGTGGLGSAYKAVMANGVAVVVKRMREMNRVGNDGFEAEMRRLGGLRHLNILPPLAFHFRKEEKLMVYEFVPKGSLLYLLHGDRGPCHAELDWPTRLKIVRGVARGMAFLHTELPNSDLPHGNLKSSNILLGPDFEPLLADFGFSPLVAPTEASTTMFAYKSPESLQYRHVSPKSDVYCLGIVILEILTGKFPSQYLNNGKGGTDVVQWVTTAIAEQRVSEVFDPEISGSGFESAHPGMERLLHVGAECAEPNVERRPDMKEAARKIEEVAAECGGPAVEERAVCPTPSLRDGYADAPGRRSHAASVRDGYGELSGQRSGRHSFGDHPSLRRNGESFAFDMS